MAARASRNGTVECHACGSILDAGSTPQHRPPFKHHHHHQQNQQNLPHDNRSHSSRFLSVLLVVCDCSLLAVQPLLVYMLKVDGKFNFNPVGVNFLTEVAKVTLTIIMLLFQHQRQKPGEKSLISPYAILKAARSNYLLAVPAFLYAINNYLKFIMQLYFNPSTVKMLSNLKVLVIALLMGMIMRRRFTVMQWEALGLLLIGITVNQLQATPIGASLGVQETHLAYLYTLIYVTIPSMASVYNEYALKSQYDTSIYLQNLFLYGYGAIFNFFAIFLMTVFKGGDGFSLFQGHSHTTLLLIINNAAQGILASFFFKYADTILKKYSSTVATIFTGLASAALFGHTLTINFVLGVSIVIISMHQFFSSSKPKDEHHLDSKLLENQTNSGTKELPLSTFIGIGDKASYKADSGSETEPLLPV